MHVSRRPSPILTASRLAAPREAGHNRSMQSEPASPPPSSDMPSAADTLAARQVSKSMVWLSRWLLGIFFRQVEVVGADQVPTEGPVVYVANHVNSLVDPALLLGFLPRRSRFLAKSTLWQMAILKPFLHLAAAIPVYRKQDVGVDTSKNAQTFARCHEVLAAEGVIALFPEGISHNKPALVPLRTGVSRIVLQAEARFSDLGVRIVPVGLTFDAKARFRSRALIVVGPALDPAHEVAAFDDGPREAVRELTERISDAMEEVTLNFPSWDEARLIERAAEIYERPVGEAPLERRLSTHFPVRQAFIHGYHTLRQRVPRQVEAVAEAVADYDELLDDMALTDAQVAARYPVPGSLRFVVWSLLILLLRLPLALVGTLYNAMPYQLADWIARRNVGTEDVTATYKLLASMLFYPLTWVAGALAGGWFWGWGGALMAGLLGPLSGFVALRFMERRRLLLRQVRAFFVLEGARRRSQELRLRRLAVSERLEELVALYEALTPSEPDPVSKIR